MPDAAPAAGDQPPPPHADPATRDFDGPARPSPATGSTGDAAVHGDAAADGGPTGTTRRRLGAEVWIVLGLSLGQAAVYAAVRLYARLTVDVPLAQQTATLNPSRSERPYLDLLYQLLSIGFALVPVALALYLLSANGRRATRLIGLDGARPARDLGLGLTLAATVGIPGLAFYVLGRLLGLNVQIQASGLDPYWWALPILVLSALQNALLEEVVAVGYLVERLREMRWGVPGILAASALLRGAYHLYQGPGMAIGNVAMGLLFTAYYLRRRRVMPLVVAHTALDVVAFVGYTVLPEDVLRSIGIT